MEKSALAGERREGTRPPPFTLFTITYKLQYTPCISSLPYMYSMLETYGCVVRISGLARPLVFTSKDIFFRLRGRGPVGPGAGGCHRCGQQGLQQQPAADRRTEAAPTPATRQVEYSKISVWRFSTRVGVDE
jgi:hypothetical protein